MTDDPVLRGERVVLRPAQASDVEALVFRPVGVMRQYERSPDGSWRDGLLMELLADELA